MIIDLGEGPKKLYDRRNTLRYTGYNRCWISGMQSRYLIIGAEKGSSMMGAHFRTGGAAPFFGFPISELTANVVELDLIWKREIVSLREQLIEATARSTPSSICWKPISSAKRNPGWNRTRPSQPRWRRSTRGR